MHSCTGADALVSWPRREARLVLPGTYDEQGWLTIGFCGHQPSLGEHYISTGSAYLASLAFLPLGLPPQHPFWTAPAVPFTSQRLYQGLDMTPDRAVF